MFINNLGELFELSKKSQGARAFCVLCALSKHVSNIFRKRNLGKTPTDEVENQKIFL